MIGPSQPPQTGTGFWHHIRSHTKSAVEGSILKFKNYFLIFFLFFSSGHMWPAGRQDPPASVQRASHQSLRRRLPTRFSCRITRQMSPINTARCQFFLDASTGCVLAENWLQTSSDLIYFTSKPLVTAACDCTIPMDNVFPCS
jgi:hypothetical protein